MSTRITVVTGALAALTLMGQVASAAVQYDAIVEWNGPYFRVVNGSTLNQQTDTPVIDIPFESPFGIAANTHGSRDVIYIVDSGNNRIQAFETNATYIATDETAFTFQAGGVAAASDWDTDQIYLAEWVAGAATWIVPYSETVMIDGETWTRVESLTGFVAADQVYAIDYDDATNAPEITFPASSLSATSEFDLKYLKTDDQTGATAAFGIGDVDYGTGNGAAPVLTEINESTSGGPSTFEQLRGLALVANETTATSDDLFVVDAADATQQLFYYTVALAGTVTFGELYEDELDTPWDVAAAYSGSASTAATVTPSADTGPFDLATAAVTDDSQITGHTYDVTVAAGNVTITDATTGRVLVASTAFANLDDPCLIVPGCSLPLNAVVGTSITIATAKAAISRYVFVADTGNDRIKVIGLPGGAGFSGGWLASDERTLDVQPTGAGTVGDTAGEDYSESTPATVTEDLVFWTATAPLTEGSLATITFDPDGTPETWTRVDDITTAGPADQVYEVNWQNGQIRFGDGIHGELPPASTAFEYTYATTPDVVHYGTSGTGSGRFSGPKGIAARYNTSTGAYDVYVADSGNNRIQKLAFFPANDLLGIDARVEYVTSWSTGASVSDLLGGPVDVVVLSDGTNVWVAVADGGNDRVVIYDDTEAAAGTGGTDAPTYDATLGSSGTGLGQYMDVASVALLANGTDLDIYAADGARDFVTKYEESPTPTVTVTWTGLPDCFPPTGSWAFSWAITNAPSGGYIDFYYDTASTFDEDTAELLFTSESIPVTETEATWNFADSPGGTPADGEYYIYARVYNASGNVVATDQTLATELLCLDSNLLPTISLNDRLDGDQTLYLQNGLARDVELVVQYPDSVISVAFTGTYDATTIEITGIVQGTAFDGIGATNIIFDTTFNNTAGTFQVFCSALDTPSGLTANGPHVVANVTFKAKATAITTAARTSASTIAIDNAGTVMVDVNGESPDNDIINDLEVKIAYLGDLAAAGGAGGTLPNLTVNPDGLINFNDQMVFALGFNGSNSVRDRIADIGPITGTTPDVTSSPDAEWDVDDILTFTEMFSWAAANGFTGTSAFNGNGASSSFQLPLADLRPAPLGNAVAGDAYLYTVSDVENALPGSEVVVQVKAGNLRNLNGALLNVAFDGSQLELVQATPGDLFTEGASPLFLHRAGQGWVEMAANRLDAGHPGVDGEGTLANLVFRVKEAVSSDLDVQYDLRSATNTVLSRGTMAAGPVATKTAELRLYTNYPNPVKAATTIVYSIPNDAQVDLNVFDPSGRLVRNLFDGPQTAGFHAVTFDGRSDHRESLPAGVYFYKLEVGGQSQTQKLVITR